jgi:hypothetical protein
MWVACKFGFFSIVQKDGGWHVRARNPQDLQLLQNAVGGEFATEKIHLTAEADYCSRIFIKDDANGIGRAAFDRMMDVVGASVDYGNFKDSIADNPTQEDKMHAYHRVWATMLEYQLDSQAAAKNASHAKRHQGRSSPLTPRGRYPLQSSTACQAR